MKMYLSTLSLSTLTLAGALCGAAPASAQTAGGATTVEATITESTRIAASWSVKKTLIGKTIYSDAGQKVGNIDGLIISPDRNVSYVIVGAGGFVGIGRHDVAIPVTQIKDQAGKLVMAGANKDTIKSMPEFTYAFNTSSATSSWPPPNTASPRARRLSLTSRRKLARPRRKPMPRSMCVSPRCGVT